MKTESTSSKWRSGQSGKGDRSRVSDKDKYDEGYERVFGARLDPLENRDMSWLEERSDGSNPLEEN